MREIMNCKFCGKEYILKSKYSISGHLARCKKWSEYKNNILTKNYLLEEYEIKERSAIEIANEHGISSAISIIKLLKKYEIKQRTIKESKNERELKKRKNTNLKKYGYEHNFCKEHPSRKKWEKELYEKEGITNVRQRKEVIKKIQNKSKKTRIKNGKEIPDKLKSEWKKYKQKVVRLSEKTYKEYKQKINPYNLVRGRNNYHLDHIYPIRYGFLFNVPKEVISNPNNLRMLSENENIGRWQNENKKDYENWKTFQSLRY